MRAEGDEACCGFRHFLAVMALPASLQAISRKHFRFRIIRPQDAVASMAVVAICCIGIAQGVNLTVIGVCIGFQILFMATTTYLGDVHFE